MTLDELLNSPQFKQALFDVHDQKCERYAETMEPVTFSPKFERKMERLLRAHRKPYYSLINTKPKRAMLAVALTIILMITMVFSVSALREPVIQFFVEVYEKFSQVFFQHNEEEQFPATLEVYYTPTWLPEGYRGDPAQTLDIINLCERVYVSESGQDILFGQYTITSSALRIDTEGVEIESVILSGNAGLYFSNKGFQYLTWNDGQYGFSVSGPVSKADIVRLAESIQPE